jgi:hypothetical protein
MVVLPVFCGLKLARRTGIDDAARERISLGMMRAGSCLICASGLFYFVAALKSA